MALVAIGNVNLEFANTGQTSTIGVVVTQNVTSAWVRWEGLSPQPRLAPDQLGGYYGTQISNSVVDGNGNTIVSYEVLNNQGYGDPDRVNPFHFLAKFDAAGNILWKKQLSVSSPATSTLLYKVMCLDANDDIYLCGEIDTSKNIIITKITNSSNPSIAWSKNYNIPEASTNLFDRYGVKSINEKNGKLYITGIYFGIFCVHTSDGSVVWGKYTSVAGDQLFGVKSNTNLVASTILNGNVYAVSDNAHYLIHNFNANTGSWQDTRSYFRYNTGGSTGRGYGSLTNDGQDLYIKMWEITIKVEGANTSNVIWAKRHGNTQRTNFSFYRVGWTDITYDATSNTSNNLFVSGFNFGPYYATSASVFSLDKNTGNAFPNLTGIKTFTSPQYLINQFYAPFQTIPVIGLSGGHSEKPRLSAKNNVVTLSGTAIMNASGYYWATNQSNINQNYVSVTFRSNSDLLITKSASSNIGTATGPAGVGIVYTDDVKANTVGNVVSHVYTWLSSTVTPSNFTVTLNNLDSGNPSVPANNIIINELGYSYPNVSNWVQGWIPDTYQSMAMEANSVINQPNTKSFIADLGANTEGRFSGSRVFQETIFNSSDIDSEGNILTIGHTRLGNNASRYENTGYYKGQLTKWSKNGEIIWSKTIRAPGIPNAETGNYLNTEFTDTYGISVRVNKTDDSVYATTETGYNGDYDGGFQLLKFDKNGNLQWSKLFVDQWDCMDLWVDRDGNSYYIGSWPWVVSFTSSGQYRWSITYDEYSDLYPLCATYDSNANILLIGDTSYSNVYAFDRNGNYKWTYDLDVPTSNDYRILHIAIDDTQANTWYVSQVLDPVEDTGRRGTPISKIQGYENPNLIYRKYIRHIPVEDYGYNMFLPAYTPFNYSATKIIPKNNKLYLGGGFYNYFDGAPKFIRIDKDFTTIDVNTGFYDFYDYSFEVDWWWNYKAEQFNVDDFGMITHTGYYTPGTINEDLGVYNFDTNGYLIRLPGDGTLSHEYDDIHNYGVGGYMNDIVRPEWLKYSYIDESRVIINGVQQNANLGWIQSITSSSTGKTTDHTNTFKRNGRFFYIENDVPVEYDTVTNYIIDVSNDQYVYDTFNANSTLASGFANNTIWNTNYDVWITLDSAIGNSYANNRSKLLDMSINEIRSNARGQLHLANTYKSWVYQEQTWNYQNNYVAYRIGQDVTFEPNGNNVILLQDTELFDSVYNDTVETATLIKHDEYGRKLWSRSAPVNWSRFPVTRGVNPQSITVDSANNYYVLMDDPDDLFQALSSNNYSGNAIVMKVDSQGNKLWAKKYRDGGIRTPYIYSTNNMLFMTRGGYGNDFNPRPFLNGRRWSSTKANLYRLNPDNGNIIWAANNTSNLSYAFSVTRHKDTLLVGSVQGLYHTFDFNGTYLGTRQLSVRGFTFGRDITAIESDGVDYYLLEGFNVCRLTKIDGTTHLPIWSIELNIWAASGADMKYEDGKIHIYVHGFDAAAVIAVINPEDGMLLSRKLLSVGLEGLIHTSANFSLKTGLDVKDNRIATTGYVDNFEVISHLTVFDYDDVQTFNDDYEGINYLRDYGYTGNTVIINGRNAEISYSYPYNRYVINLYLNGNVYNNVITTNTFSLITPSSIQTTTLNEDLIIDAEKYYDNTYWTYENTKSELIVLSKPLYDNSNSVITNTNVSINFTGGLISNTFVYERVSEIDGTWMARWGGDDQEFYWPIDYLWTTGASRYETSFSEHYATKFDNLGNIWACGYYRDPYYNLGPNQIGYYGGSQYGLIIKYDSSGNLLKYFITSEVMDTSENQKEIKAIALAIDSSDNVYTLFIDDNNYNAIVTKMTNSGNVVWTNIISDNYDDNSYGFYSYQSTDIVIDEASNKLFMIFATGGGDTVVCVDADTGELLWGKIADQSGPNYTLNSYCAAIVNDLLLVGYDQGIIMAYDFDGNLQWSRQVFYDWANIYSMSWDGSNLYACDQFGDIFRLSGDDLETVDWIIYLEGYVGTSDFPNYPDTVSIKAVDGKVYVYGRNYHRGSQSLGVFDYGPQLYHIDAETGTLERVTSLFASGVAHVEGSGGGYIAPQTIDVKDNFIAFSGSGFSRKDYDPYDRNYDAAILKFKDDDSSYQVLKYDNSDLYASPDLFLAKIAVYEYNTVVTPANSVYYKAYVDDFRPIVNNITYTVNTGLYFTNTSVTNSITAYDANVKLANGHVGVISTEKFTITKTPEILNVSSLYVITKNNSDREIISYANTTVNATNSLIRTTSFREKGFFRRRVESNNDIIINLNEGTMFSYRPTGSSFYPSNVVNAIYIIENNEARKANAVQQFTLFTNKIGRIANSTWANANIAWPRHSVPRGPIANSLYQYSFMKLPDSNVWYGFTQANTANVNIAKVKVLNVIPFTTESITGTPIWEYDNARGNNALIVKFNDATGCGGSNTYSGVKQESTYSFIFESEADIYLTSMNVTSNVESGRDGYDRLKIVYTKIGFSGAAQTVIYEAFSQNTAGQLTCIGRPAYVNIAPATNIVLRSNTYHKFDLIANTVDSSYHSGSYYSILFDFRKRES